MENSNNYHNVNDSNNNKKTTFLVFSILGWIIYLICGWVSLKYLFDDNVITSMTEYKYSFVMTIYRLPLIEDTDEIFGLVYPLQIQTSVLYIIIILTMFFALFAFIVYMVKLTCAKEDAISDGMLGNVTGFHFVPLLIAASLFLIGICYKEIEDAGWKSANIVGIIFDILGLVSLIFIYIKTDLPDDWLTATIKKGAYSTLISLEWYYFCYIICNLATVDYKIDKYSNKERINGIKNCGIIMPIIEAIGAYVFSFIFKDVIVAFINVLIFLGASIYYLSIDLETRNDYGGHDATEGIIDIVFGSLSIVIIIILIIWKGKECLK